MDQWASESINLLVESTTPIVKLDTIRTSKWTKPSHPQRSIEVSSIVSDLNTPDDYENFCLAMDELRNLEAVNLTRPQIDRAVMGNTKKVEGSWRKYVVAQRDLREGIAVNENGN